MAPRTVIARSVGLRAAPLLEELLSSRVQSEQDPNRRDQDQCRDNILRVGGYRRPDQQGGDYEGSLLHPGAIFRSGAWSCSSTAIVRMIPKSAP